MSFGAVVSLNVRCRDARLGAHRIENEERQHMRKLIVTNIVSLDGYYEPDFRRMWAHGSVGLGA